MTQEENTSDVICNCDHEEKSKEIGKDSHEEENCSCNKNEDDKEDLDTSGGCKNSGTQSGHSAKKHSSGSYSKMKKKKSRRKKDKQKEREIEDNEEMNDEVLPPKSAWLLRLFESKLFDMAIAIAYLFNSKENGVLAYLGNRLFVSYQNFLVI